MPAMRRLYVDGIPATHTTGPAATSFFAEILAAPSAPGPCMETDPEIFHPNHPREAVDAIHICLTQCAYRRECAQIALSSESRMSGVWAGILLPTQSRDGSRASAIARLHRVANLPKEESA